MIDLVFPRALRNISSATKTLAVSSVALTCGTVGFAQNHPTYNAYGLPGIIDMPTAQTMDDSDLATTFAIMGSSIRSTLSYQITPRISGSFRYSALNELALKKKTTVRFDRSFDIRYQLVEEGRNLPGVVVGIQDFMGTEFLGAEYIAATKEVAPGLNITAGLGWGRLGSKDPIGKTGDRPSGTLDKGGIPNYDRWFRGDVAPFAGITYAPRDDLTFKLEYSSDNYTRERTNGNFLNDGAYFDGTSQVNAGVDWWVGKNTQLSLYHNYGNEYGLQLTLVSNPRKSPAPSRFDTAPLPVSVRSPASKADLSWQVTDTRYETQLANLLKVENLTLEGMTLEQKKATVRIRNNQYGEVSQAVGRSARAMSRILPGSVETFVIIPTNGTVAMSAVTVKRSDLEALEHEAATEMLARVAVSDSVGQTPAVTQDIYPQFSWRLAPNLGFSLFDPATPVRIQANLDLTARYQLSPNWVISGAVRQKLGGNLDKSKRDDKTDLPPVRTDSGKYFRQTDIGLSNLTVAHYGRPGKNLYSRVSAGYFEPMYGGLSGELLWKPVDSRLALGLEINAVKQRAFDGGFDFRDYETVTGHASAYYEFKNGFVGGISAGRYLAKDEGGTISLDREFPNGWRIGGYATFTNVSAEDFGEGSFDKGIRISIPTSSLTQKPSKVVRDFDIQSLTRDGGSRVVVPGRLYDGVRKSHKPQLENSWGRFWR